MDSDQYSLSRLHDIVVPEPVSWWPLAPGLWVVLAVATVVLVALTWRFRISWRANAYRRAGLVLLAGAGTAHDISVILKRVALAAFPREQVASLYGTEWVAFLNQTCPQCDFTECLAEQDDAGSSQQLLDVSMVWVKQHTRTLNPEP